MLISSVTTDIGPRIIHFSFPGDENVFAEFPDQLGQTGGDDWRIYGGHRLWAAPESVPRTYHPDNNPVKIHDFGNFVRLTAPIEPKTGIQKEIDISLSPNNTKVKVVHRICNHNLWTIELAPVGIICNGAGWNGRISATSRRVT